MTKYVTEEAVTDADCCYECWKKAQAAAEDRSVGEKDSPIGDEQGTFTIPAILNAGIAARRARQ